MSNEIKKLLSYLEENSRGTDILPSEAVSHNKLIRFLYDDHRKLGYDNGSAFANVPLIYRQKNTSMDLVVVSGKDVVVVECKSNPNGHKKKKAHDQLNFFKNFVNEEFRVNPRLVIASFTTKDPERHDYERIEITYIQ
jgi:hypothetical protein